MRKAKSTVTDVGTQTGSLVQRGPQGAVLDQHREGFYNKLLRAGRGDRHHNQDTTCSISPESSSHPRPVTSSPIATPDLTLISTD